MPLRRRFDATHCWDKRRDPIRAAAPSAAGPAGAAWVEFGDDFWCGMAEEMRHGEKAAAENARGDFGRSKRDL